MAINIGDQAPDFTTQDDSGDTITLSSFKGKNALALIFYPKDDTPG